MKEGGYLLRTNEKIRILLKRKNVSITELSNKIGTTRQNLTNKLSRNNFSEKDLSAIATALECNLILEFEDQETKERI